MPVVNRSTANLYAVVERVVPDTERLGILVS